MHAYLHCLSHSPLVGYVDPAQEVLDEVNGVIASARERIAAFSPELVVLFAPDHYNGFFYDVMPPFCLGVGATAIGDFGSAAGELPVPVELAEACAHAVMKSGIDLAVSYCMQVDHGFAQPLEFLLGGLDKVPVLPVFINGVATPLPGFQRTRMLGEAIGRFTSTLNKRVLFLGSGGLSHQPPVPELAKADAHMRDRLLGSGKDLPASERELRQQRVISAAEKFVEDQRTLHPLNPIWDNQFMTLLEQGRIQELDAVSNEELSAIAGKSTHEIKTWVAAFAAISAFGNWRKRRALLPPNPGVDCRIWLVKRQNRELNMQEKMMSYQPQTEAATSRFLNVEEAGKTLRIHFNDCGQGDETVVLLHGSGPGATGWANFSRNIDPLVEAGYRVILLDCPGWGKSDSVVNSGSRSDLNARILKSVVDQLDIAKIHLLGNSMGGHSSVAFTLKWPERVGKLVLMGGGTGGMSLFTPMPTEGIKRLNQLYRQPTIENLKLMMDIFVFDTSDLTDALFEARLNNMLSRRDHLENFVKSLEANPKQFPDFGPRLAEIKAQTLIVWGRNDRFVPMDAGLRLLSGIAGSELHIFRDCGHWAQWEHADAFNQLVLNFLARP